MGMHTQQGQAGLGAALWADAEPIRQALMRAETLDHARQHFHEELQRVSSALLRAQDAAEPLERALQWDAIHTLQAFLSQENESAAGMSTMKVLWELAVGVREPEEVPGFVEEMRHLFKAMRGDDDWVRGWLGKEQSIVESYFDGLPEEGRRAAKRRSRFLDEAAERVQDRVNQYPCGLDEPLQRQRQSNRRRIREALGAGEAAWDDWRWQARHVLKGQRGLETLRALVPVTNREATSVHEAVEAGIPWGITPYYLSLFDSTSASRRQDEQVRAQVMPPRHLVRAMARHKCDRSEALDFMREHDTSPIDRITRRYPHVAIIKVCGVCPQICTYCQRNWEIDDAMVWERLPSANDLDPALDWLSRHPAVFDVLVTGGDPLVLPDDLLFHVLERLAAMPHVRHIRIGTRIPVTLPMRITPALADRLGGLLDPGRRNISLVTHVQSGLEITPELTQAVSRLKRRGISVFNQLVFTVHTSRRFQNAATRIALNRAGIVPYYTFYPKGKSEHREYLVPIARMLQERKEEARLLPGIMRTDEPVFNVPRLGKHHLRAGQDREWIAVRLDGRRIYRIHPWEKGIAPVEPWTCTDVSIYEYLERMKARGEDPRDYESIWYYR
jgi:lysine 2,3-aminomutase